MTVEINEVHPLATDREQFNSIQTNLQKKIQLKNAKGLAHITSCAGVDVAYWKEAGIEWGVCSIVVIDYETNAVIEQVHDAGKITVPYVPGYLAFRELPLVVKAAKKLTLTPDLFLFDGNGYLHPRHLGIATHASFFLDRPSIGVAKNPLIIDGVDYPMPENKPGAYAEIKGNGQTYGRVLRTHQDVKPIYISCGNYIDLQTTTEIVLQLVNQESRLPIPVRLADLASRQKRKAFS